MATQLTKNAIDSMINSSNTDDFYVIQILTVPKHVADNLYRVTISDGFCKFKKGYFIGDAGLKCQDLKEFCIIKCNKLIDETSQDKERVIIPQYDLICPNVNEIIGRPIEYKVYKQAGLSNPEGSVIIPAIYLSRNAQAQQQQFASLPKQITAPQNQNNKNFNNNEQKPAPNNHQSLNRVTQNPNNMTKSTPVGPSHSASGNLTHSNENDEKNLEDIRNLTPNEIASFKARVTKKGDMKNYNKNGKEGKLFSIDVIDANSDETTVSFFNETAVKFEGQFSVNQVLIFKSVSVKPNTSPAFNKGQNVVTMNKDSQILLANDDGSIPLNNFKKRTIADIEKMDKDQLIDLICIVKQDSSFKNMNLKSGENKARRDVLIFDESQVEIEVSLWGDTASNNDAKKGDIIVFKDARIGVYKEKKQLNVGYGTQIYINPNNSVFPQAMILQKWYQSVDKSTFDSSLQRIGGTSEYNPSANNTSKLEYSIQYLNEEISKSQHKLDENFKIWKEVRAQVLFIKDTPLYYNACPKCKKKVQIEVESFNCNHCQLPLPDGPESRYITSLMIGDATDTMWVSAFDDAGKKIFNFDANVFRHTDDDKEQGGADTKKKLLMAAQNKEYRFLLLVKAERDQNQEFKHKTVIQQVKDLDPADESKKILNSLEKYLELH